MYHMVVILFAVLCCGMGVFFFAFEAQMKQANEVNKADKAKKAAEEVDSAPQETASVNVLQAKNTMPWAKKVFMVAMCVVLIALAIVRIVCHPETELSVNMKLLASVAVLWPCAWIDFKTLRISNKMMLWCCGVRVALLVVEVFLREGGLQYTLVQEAIAVVAMLVVCLLCRLVVPKSIGYGDVKLLMVMGMFLGSSCLWDAVFMSMVLSFIVALVMLLTKRARRQDVMPFAPFLMGGATIAAFLLEM